MGVFEGYALFCTNAISLRTRSPIISSGDLWVSIYKEKLKCRNKIFRHTSFPHLEKLCILPCTPIRDMLETWILLLSKWYKNGLPRQHKPVFPLFCQNFIKFERFYLLFQVDTLNVLLLIINIALNKQIKYNNCGNYTVWHGISSKVKHYESE